MNLKENLGSKVFDVERKKEKKMLKNQKGKHASALTLQLLLQFIPLTSCVILLQLLNVTFGFSSTE